MARVYLGLGSNLGDKKRYLNAAIERIQQRIGHIVSQSDFITTQPWGFESDNTFLNAVVIVETSLAPIDLLHTTQTIEKELGRVQDAGCRVQSVENLQSPISYLKSKNYKDRTIDIDILLYDDLIINTEELIIPHPLMEERDFVMIPLRQAREREVRG